MSPYPAACIEMETHLSGTKDRQESERSGQHGDRLPCCCYHSVVVRERSVTSVICETMKLNTFAKMNGVEQWSSLRRSIRFEGVLRYCCALNPRYAGRRCPGSWQLDLGRIVATNDRPSFHTFSAHILSVLCSLRFLQPGKCLKWTGWGRWWAFYQ